MTRARLVVVAVVVALVAAGCAYLPGGPQWPARNAAPSTGCESTSPAVPGRTTVTTTSSGVARTYIRYVPPGYSATAPVPVVVDFHGLGEGAEIHTIMSGFGDLANEEGFVAVFPQGIVGSPVRWDTSIGGQDHVFFGDLLDELEASLCVDRNRIYVAGLSYGAFMTSSLVCDFSDRVAAFAPLAGIRTNISGCSPARPAPVITFHGTADTFVPFTSGPVPAIVASWAQRNGCKPDAVEQQIASDVAKIHYPCWLQSDVELYRIDGGGHAWPGSEFSRSIEAIVGFTTFSINATQLMWQFFENHPLKPAILPS